MASREKIRRVARGKAKKYGVNPDLYEALVRQESNFDERAGSPAGARGPAQLMPGTARALGVNPDNPRQNLDGGARYLKQQLDRFGGDVKKALAAYNAGPGAVEKYGGVPPYAETQNYVNRILKGKNARRLRNGRSGSSTARKTTTTTKTTPGVDRSGERKQLIAQYLLEKRDNPKTSVVPTALALADAKDTPAKTVTTTRSTSTRKRRGGGKGGARIKGTLRESFYNGPGGRNVDEGKDVPTGFVKEHKDHVHAAFDTPAEAIRWGKVAQRMGLTVREQSRFDPVDPVHTKGSFHYSDRAIDVSGPPAKMAAFSRRLARAR